MFCIPRSLTGISKCQAILAGKMKPSLMFCQRVVPLKPSRGVDVDHYIVAQKDSSHF